MLTETGLPPHIAFLMEPGAAPWPGTPELVQTHISFVLLWERDVLKIKKAVKFDFLDFSSVEERHHACREELRVNRRGCDSVYLGVLPVTRRDGAYALDGTGEVVDWAVHMRRLTAAGMMDHLLAAGEFSHDRLETLVGRLDAYYRDAPQGIEITDIGSADNFSRRWLETLDNAAGFEEQIVSRERMTRLRALAVNAIERLKPLMMRRSQSGWIRDCHGDLRSDAICFDADARDRICLFDAIEFDVRYRYQDVALDVAFLAMDLDYRGHRQLSDVLVGLMMQALGDGEMALLMSAFKSYRAAVRGLVEGLQTLEPEIDAAQRATAAGRAAAYFDLAFGYLERPRTQCAVVVMGLSGSGKSTLAGAVAARTGSVLVSSDLLRKAQIEPEDDARYSAEGRNAVYERMVAAVREAVDAGEGVVADATFIKARHRAAVLAALGDIPYIVVECVVPPSLIRERQEKRQRLSWRASEGTWEVYQRQLQEYEPPTELPPRVSIRVDTSQGIEPALDLVEAHLRAMQEGP